MHWIFNLFVDCHVKYTKVRDGPRYSLEEKVSDILLKSKFYIPPTRPDLVPRKRLIDKIGLERVQWLEDNSHVVKKWEIDELKELIKIYKEKTNYLKK